MNPNIDFSYKSADDIQRELNTRPTKRSKTHDFDFVKDGLDTQNIRNTIKDIKLYIDNNKKTTDHEEIISKLKLDFAFFAQRYPMLFAMVTKQGEFDSSSLEYFLNMREKIIANELTSDEASKQVGQDWFDKYVDTSKLNKK